MPLCATLYWQLSSPTDCVRLRSVSWLCFWLGAIGRCGWRWTAARASGLSKSRANAWPRAYVSSAMPEYPAALFFAYWPNLWREASRQSGALWKDRWRSPAWWTPHRASPHGCDASLREQILRPGLKGICPPGRLLELVRWFRVQAWNCVSFQFNDFIA